MWPVTYEQQPQQYQAPSMHDRRPPGTGGVSFAPPPLQNGGAEAANARERVESERGVAFLTVSTREAPSE